MPPHRNTPKRSNSSEFKQSNWNYRRVQPTLRWRTVSMFVPGEKSKWPSQIYLMGSSKAYSWGRPMDCFEARWMGVKVAWKER